MVRAIDVHIHPPGPHGESLTSSEEAQKYFRTGKPPESVEEMEEYYAKLDIFGVVFTIDNESVSGRPPASNDYIADIAKSMRSSSCPSGAWTHGRVEQPCGRFPAARRSWVCGA